jgi:hypothetical protein
LFACQSLSAKFSIRTLRLPLPSVPASLNPGFAGSLPRRLRVVFSVSWKA